MKLEWTDKDEPFLVPTIFNWCIFGKFRFEVLHIGLVLSLLYTMSYLKSSLFYLILYFLISRFPDTHLSSQNMPRKVISVKCKTVVGTSLLPKGLLSIRGHGLQRSISLAWTASLPLSSPPTRSPVSCLVTLSYMRSKKEPGWFMPLHFSSYCSPCLDCSSTPCLSSKDLSSSKITQLKHHDPYKTFPFFYCCCLPFLLFYNVVMLKVTIFFGLMTYKYHFSHYSLFSILFCVSFSCTAQRPIMY